VGIFGLKVYRSALSNVEREAAGKERVTGAAIGRQLLVQPDDFVCLRVKTLSGRHRPLKNRVFLYEPGQLTPGEQACRGEDPRLCD